MFPLWRLCYEYGSEAAIRKDTLKWDLLDEFMQNRQKIIGPMELNLFRTDLCKWQSTALYSIMPLWQRQYSPKHQTKDAHSSHSSVVLTHWGRDKIAAISQTTFSNAFSWMKINEFCLRFHWNLFLSCKLIIFQHWFRKWLGTDQAIVFAQSIEASYVENEDVVGAAPTGAAPTTSEWSTMLLPTTKGWLISEVWLLPYSSNLIALLTFAGLCFHCGDCAMNMEVRRRSGRIPWNGIYRMSSCKTDRRPMDRWSWIFFVLTYVNGRVLPYIFYIWVINNVIAY